MSGRRLTIRGRRVDRIDRVAVAALVMPLLTAVLLALVAGREGSDRFGVRDEPAPPTTISVSSATVICPGGIDRTFLSSAAAGGDVTVREVTTQGVEGAEGVSVSVRSGEVRQLPMDDAARVISAEGAVAPSLVASRFTLPFAASECREPDPELWFTGVGAGARFSSALELVNPDPGPAVVDIAVYGRSGQVTAPQLRGLAVPPRGSVRLDLAEIVPRRDELAMRVVASRGRVRASISGRLDRLDGGEPSVDWLPGQPAPQTTNRLLGADEGTGQRTLVLANPGESEARATIRLITPESVFVPLGSQPVVVPPRSALRIDAAPLLRAPNAQGVIGLEVQSSLPLTAALRALVSDDLAFVAASDPVASSTALIVPTGSKRLYLSGATGPGSILIRTTDARGRSEQRKEVEVVSGRGYIVPLPDQAALLRIDPQRTLIEAAVVRSDAGSAPGGGQGTVVLRMRDLVRQSLVPGVQPGPPS